MINWKWIGTQALHITGIVLCGFAAIGVAGLFIKAWGLFYV